MSRLMLVVLVSAFFCISCMRGNPADLILADGMVYFADDKIVQNSTIIINGNRIVDILDKDDSYNHYVGQDTHIVQLNKQLLLPGFIDVNIDLGRAVGKLNEPNLLMVDNDEGLQKELLRLFTRLSKGSWITGGNWGAYEKWVLESGAETDRWYPRYDELSAISEGYPVFINSFDQKIYFANHKALQLAGIDSSIIPGMALDENVKPTGIIYAGSPAISLIKAKIPLVTTKLVNQDAVAVVLNQLISQGITEIHTRADKDLIQVLADLERNNRLFIRVQLFQDVMENEFAEKDLAYQHIDGFLRRAGYYFQADDESEKSSGSRLFQLAEMLDSLNDEELPLMTFWHEPVNLSRELGTYMELSSKFDFSHRIILTENVHLDFRENLFVEVNPNDFIEHVRRKPVNGELLQDVDVNELSKKRIPLLFGSGWPGNHWQYRNFHPAYLIYSASYMFDADEPTRLINERLSIHDILQAYTQNAVKFIGDDDRGIIKVGNIADLVILNKNIVQQGITIMSDYKVAMTITGGKIVYTAD